MQRIHSTISIHRPLEEVFRFYTDFRNMPRFLGDVVAVELIGPALSRWTIQGPLGIRVHWNVRVSSACQDQLLRYETVAPPALRTSWEIRFAASPSGVETEISEMLTVPLGTAGRLALELMGRFPAREVAANLQRLKQVLEGGKVVDRRYSVAGKF
jgi:uncharacterized membrane protein